MPFAEEVFFPNTFGMELIYSFVIIFCSLMIYFATKKMYDISKYPGIKYFREAFLFFAIAYFFKSFISFFVILFDVHEIFEFVSLLVGVLSVLIFMYASTMAIFYLLYSVIWKKLKDRGFIIPLIHVLVLAISVLSILAREARILILLQIVIFLVVAVYNLVSYNKLKRSKRENSIYAIYLFLFVFWMLNLSDILVSGFSPILELIISTASIAIFLVILYKVTKNVGFS